MCPPRRSAHGRPRRHAAYFLLDPPRLEPRLAPAIFIVNSLADDPDAAPGDGDADIAEGDGPITVTLRSAIEEANALPGADEIRFDIREPGLPTIRPASPLPSIREAVLIDGYTQPGAAPGTQRFEVDATPQIEISGEINSYFAGLIFESGASTVRGLVITGFRVGIFSSADNVTITGNFLGIRRDGRFSGSNGTGVDIRGAGNIVGGPTPDLRNLISHNTVGIEISSPGRGNLVQGNFVGTNRTGMEPAPNADVGIRIVDSHANQIGGATLDAGNVVSANIEAQIQISASRNNVIEGNRIGVAASGDSPMSIGGARHGILIDRASAGNVIGGLVSGAGNVIGSNGTGVTILDASSNVVQGNFIGVAPNGTPSLHNMGAGVELQGASEGNLIGGFTPGSGNVIANNGFTFDEHPGVLVAGPARGTLILRNSFFQNAGLEIDLSSSVDFDGPTANDPGDTDTGGNDLQNAPVLTTLVLGATTLSWQGSLRSLPNTPYRIEFFIEDFAGEPRRYFGFTDVTTDASGHADFNRSLPGIAEYGDFGSATATHLSTGTSEFSSTVSVTGPAGPDLAVYIEPDIPVAIPGEPMSFNFTLANRGTSVARDVAASFSIPLHTTFLSFEGPDAFTPTLPPVGQGGEIRLSSTSLPAGFSYTFTVVVLVEPGASEARQLGAYAVVAVEEGEPFADNNIDLYFVSVYDLPPAVLWVHDVVVTEHDDFTSAIVTVALTTAVRSPVTVRLTLQDGTAVAREDYSPLARSLTFEPGAARVQSVEIPIRGDIDDEPFESFYVVLSNPEGAAIGDGVGRISILNDDAPPTVSVADTWAVEGSSSFAYDETVFPVTFSLSHPPKQTVTVEFTTTPEGATAGPGDYLPRGGMLVFHPGAPLTQSWTFAVVPDMTPEPDEVFFVRLFNPQRATLGKDSARVNILDDDRPIDTGPPRLVTPGGLVRYGKGRQPTLLALTFNEPLDPATLTDLALYQVFTSGPDRRLGNADDVLHRPISLIHLPGTNQVVLRMRKRLPRGQRYELRVGAHGQAPRDLDGNLLDGDFNGQAGGLLRFRFGNNALAGGIRKAPIVPPLPTQAHSLSNAIAPRNRRAIKRT